MSEEAPGTEGTWVWGGLAARALEGGTACADEPGGAERVAWAAPREKGVASTGTHGDSNGEHLARQDWRRRGGGRRASQPRGHSGSAERADGPGPNPCAAPRARAISGTLREPRFPPWEMTPMRKPTLPAAGERTTGALGTASSRRPALNQGGCRQPQGGPSPTQQGLENKDPLEKCVSRRAAGKVFALQLRQPHNLIIRGKEARRHPSGLVRPPFLKHNLPSAVFAPFVSLSSCAQARVSRCEHPLQKVLLALAGDLSAPQPDRSAFQTGPNFAAPHGKRFSGQSLGSQGTPPHAALGCSPGKAIKAAATLASQRRNRRLEEVERFAPGPMHT